MNKAFKICVGDKWGRGWIRSHQAFGEAPGGSERKSGTLLQMFDSKDKVTTAASRRGFCLCLDGTNNPRS